MHRTTRLIIPLFAIALLLLTGLMISAPKDIQANGGGLPDIYVNGDTGDNAWNGSSPVFVSGTTGPKKTIAAGIAAVAWNGTVHVAAGTYHEHGLDLDEDMNLIGAGARSTIIDGGGAGLVLAVSSQPFQENTISGFTIQNGAPAGSDPGGGIYISQAHIVTLNDCTIKNNISGPGAPDTSGMGGGICNDGGTLFMNGCTVSGNTATADGGGIYTRQTFGGDSGLVEMTNCTVSGNSAGRGGGLFCDENATIQLVNCTITDNLATGSGGGFANLSPTTMSFKNCIVSGNSAGDNNNNGYDAGGGVGVHSQGNNIDSENTCYFNDTTDKTNTNPLLGDLQDNGGPTDTHAITGSSPAYNSGTDVGAPVSDQRGVPRPQMNTVDIGAYELSASSTATATGSGNATFATTNGMISSLAATAATSCGAPPSGYEFPHGFFGFTVTGITPGSTVVISITLPSNMGPVIQYFKCINGQWLDMTSLLGDDNGDNILTLTITDGGRGDADGQANGTVSDPGGPAMAVFPAGSSLLDDAASPYIKRPAHIGVKNINLLNSKVAVGQPVIIYANVVNKGDITGAFTTALKINGEIEQTRDVAVNGNAAVPVQFTVVKDTPGTYTVDIGGQKASFTIMETVSPATGSSRPLLFILLAGMVGAIIILSGIIAKLRQS